MLRKIVTWVVILFAVFYVATMPGSAAGAVHAAFSALHRSANSMNHFVMNL